MVQNSEPEFDIITTEGTIRVKLYSKTPRHRDNFCKLVSEHYYDSLLFHRVINGFMIQTGDPYTRDSSKAELYGQGGPDYTLPAEFVNEYYHKKGALAAARRGDTANPRRSSSGSQFYIVQDEMNCIHLDGQYTVFGETIDGLDVIDRIASAPTDRRDRPVKDIRIITIKPVEIQTKTVSDSTDVQSADSTTTVDSLAEEKKVKDRGRWFREMKSELKKVVWPSGKETMKNTGTVLLCSLIVGAFIWIFDAVAVLAVNTLIGLFA